MRFVKFDNRSIGVLPAIVTFMTGSRLVGPRPYHDLPHWHTYIQIGGGNSNGLAPGPVPRKLALVG